MKPEVIIVYILCFLPRLARCSYFMKLPMSYSLTLRDDHASRNYFRHYYL
jgi:hypothetical protein